MNQRWWLPFLVCFLLFRPGIDAQNKPRLGPKTSVTRGDQQVAPDLATRLAKFRRVQMPFHSAGLSARERQLVEKLVDAARYLERIFWLQSDPDGLSLYESLAGRTGMKDSRLRHYLWINASRFDLIDENKPLVGTRPMPLGRGFYPAGVTREEIERYVTQHPDKKAELYSPFTVVRRQDTELIGLPYHLAYRSFLEPAAKDLQDAATLSDEPAFANFLRLRADALLSDDYFQSDLAWVDLKDPKFDVIFAPYETYTDELLGVKTSYGAAVLVRNPEESNKLTIFQKYVPDIQDALPLAREDRPSKRGLQTPMEVMDAPYRAGDLRHGYQAVADNLPNDPRVHEQKGSKKIFFKNFMDARVQYVILPVARYLMPSEQASNASGEGYMLTTIMHEIAHGLGPAYARTANGKTPIREAVGPIFGGLEEAKADVVGMFGVNWLVEHGVLPREKLPEFYSSYVAGIFRTVRFGTGEAHGQAEMMEFNYLFEQGAIKRSASGYYAIQYANLPKAIADLAQELLEIEATGDRERAQNWFKKYDKMPVELQSALDRARSVPVDVDPVFGFKESF